MPFIIPFCRDSRAEKYLTQTGVFLYPVDWIVPEHIFETIEALRKERKESIKSGSRLLDPNPLIAEVEIVSESVYLPKTPGTVPLRLIRLVIS